MAVATGAGVVLLSLVLAMLSRLGQDSPPVTEPEPAPPVPQTTVPTEPTPPVEADGVEPGPAILRTSGSPVPIDPGESMVVPTPLELFGLTEGEVAPPFTGTLLGGGTFDLTRLRGQPVVVLQWATWCQPCVDGLAPFQAAATQWEGRAAFISVLTRDSSAENASRIVEEHNITLPVVIDRIGFRWFPFLFGYVLLDEEGRAITGFPGLFTSQERLNQMLEQFLN
ncbi:MAG: TlpA family protein disulfide reductase [Acidimicrobiia bacterium]